MPQLSTLELPELPITLISEDMGDLPLRGVTILAVEDSRFASESLRLICRRLGARLRRADSLQTAGAHLRLYRPDVAIVDLGLPDGRGEELIRDLSGRHPRPAVIAISGDGDRRGSALAAGADAFLEKPIAGVADLAGLLRRLFPERAGRLSAGEGVVPDRLALRDDLVHAVELLDHLPGPEGEAYVAGFVHGLAVDSGDKALVELSSGHSDPTSLRAAILTRLNSSGPAFGG
jgi:CheY-like chemotaxis protein